MDLDEAARLAGWVVLGLAIVWVVLSVLERRRREAYNLTVGEQARGAKSPDFLRVDHDKRARAMAGGGTAAVANVAQRGGLARLFGWLTTLMAVVTLVVAISGAMANVPSYTQAASDFFALLTDPQRLADSFRAHWTGIIIAAVVVIAQVGKFVAKIAKG